MIINCPNCSEIIIIEKINCGIFRHGTLIKTGKQINPHTIKKECDRLVKKNLIYGCGKPFKILIEDDKIEVTICDYI